MLERVGTTVVLTAAIALHPPAASAAPMAGCGVNALTAVPTGPDAWAGVVVGYAVSNDIKPGAVRCVVRVNGAVRATTPWVAARGAAVTAGHVRFVRTPTDVVGICAQYTTPYGTGENCPTLSLVDVLDHVYDWLVYGADIAEIAAESACEVSTSLNGSYGPVEIKPGTGGTGGDVYVNGELWWDCPTYEPFDP